MDNDKIDSKIDVEKTVLKEGPAESSESAMSMMPKKAAIAKDFRYVANDDWIYKSQGPLVSMMIAFILFSLGALMCLFLYASVVCWPWQQDWIPVEGQVTKISSHNKRSAKFSYEYRADNRTYEAAIYKPGSLKHTVKVGSKVTVRYNPERVFESYMQGGFNIVETPFYALLSVGFFLATLSYVKGIIIRGRVRDNSN